MLLRALILIVALLCVLSCANTAPSNTGVHSPGKADHGKLSDVDWANQFFITQIYDDRWNPTGRDEDTQSNNCGPASLAMLMASRGALPEGVMGQVATDHARAMMYPAYPEIDASELSEGAILYEDEGLVCVDDVDHGVFFTPMEQEPSLPQGIVHGGSSPVYGYTWNEVDTLLETRGAVIAYGHITEAWRSRFSGGYGPLDAGAIPHFILVFFASTEGDYIVCDPMHTGGAEVMDQGVLQAFFQSPINVYETTIRVVAFGD
jgi:hypothetical protein